jgi:four helix bundle protein
MPQLTDIDRAMDDPLLKYPFYVKACRLYEQMLDDSDSLGRDYRSREIVKQLVRSCGSIPPNIEEGYGRGTRQEFIYFLTVACGSARETRRWYERARRFLSAKVVTERHELLDEIIGLLVATINKLKGKGGD